MSNINIQDVPDGADNKEDFYKVFKERLEDIETFPSDYTFKFIIPGAGEHQAEIKKIFPEDKTKYTNKESKTGKYLSLTVVTYLENADAVVDYYKQVSAIKGVIML
ncbi:DUF493 domain-containing protein [Sphingobacteriaceae bacterium WQ 2009]|uniref:DUF493 domain-containing protein n=1 Tax=Rhinopithecimicrobium faecis TaxID=2820698 RepID=A0A8T4H8C3_9SPHI|nr:DUF493 domain-containing protein [Sphingobacteriaceae bacterium WQ 2009]